MDLVFQNHWATWTASCFCAFAILSLIFNRKNVIQYPFFLTLYSAGILAWTLHGLRIDSHATLYPSLAQLLILIPLCVQSYQILIKEAQNT